MVHPAEQPVITDLAGRLGESRKQYVGNLTPGFDVGRYLQVVPEIQGKPEAVAPERSELKVLPGVPELPLFDQITDLIFLEPGAAAAAVFVKYLAVGGDQDLPAASPGTVAEVRVFDIARREEVREATQFQESLLVEG
jgi:hypothetical protein